MTIKYLKRIAHDFLKISNVKIFFNFNENLVFQKQIKYVFYSGDILHYNKLKIVALIISFYFLNYCNLSNKLIGFLKSTTKKILK